MAQLHVSPPPDASQTLQRCMSPFVAVVLVSCAINLLPFTGSALMLQAGAARLWGTQIVPGLPLEALIQTCKRTALSSLTKPVSDQLPRPWRDALRQQRPGQHTAV